jgi:hypothetical protein
MKQRDLLAACALIGVAGGVYLSPLVSLGMLINAAQQGDTSRMEQLINFSELRSSINKQVKIKAENQITQSLGGRNLFSEMIASVGMLAINPVVDSKVNETVSAAGLIGALKDLQKQQQDQNKIEQVIGLGKQLSGFRLSYKNPNQALLELPNATSANATKISLLMERKQLLEWKLVDVQLNL